MVAAVSVGGDTEFYPRLLRETLAIDIRGVFGPGENCRESWIETEGIGAVGGSRDVLGWRCRGTSCGFACSE